MWASHCEEFAVSGVSQINQLAVAIYLKSVHLKCVAKSKQRRVYSSSTAYVWLLQYRMKL